MGGQASGPAQSRRHCFDLNVTTGRAKSVSGMPPPEYSMVGNCTARGYNKTNQKNQDRPTMTE
jgi:hypothetical protein